MSIRRYSADRYAYENISSKRTVLDSTEVVEEVKSYEVVLIFIIIICAGVTKNLSVNLCNNQLKLLTKVDHSVAARSLVDLIKG